MVLYDVYGLYGEWSGKVRKCTGRYELLSLVGLWKNALRFKQMMSIDKQKGFFDAKELRNDGGEK